MHIQTKRIDFEISRSSLYFRVTAFGWTFGTFQDFSGQGLSATNWVKNRG